MDEALTLAQQLAHPFSVAYVLTCAAILHWFRREGHAARRRAEEAIRLCTEQGFAYLLAVSMVIRGWALVEEGQTTEGLTEIQQGIAACQATGAAVFRPSFLALLAEAYGHRSQTDEALHCLDEALREVDKTGGQWWAEELHRLQGELRLMGGEANQAEVETCFLQALAIARQQQAKSLELRAATSLARLWQQQGKRAEAHALLAPVYGWFTEGFDTADLQEAKALLEALAA
jgi:predicted ATPase